MNVKTIIKNKNLLTLSMIAMTGVTAIVYFLSSTQTPSEVGISHSDEYKAEAALASLQSDQNSNEHDQTTRVLGFESKFGGLPDSLRGTVLVNALQVDENGHLIITSNIKDLFDYFLSTITEEELDLILLRVDEYLNYYLQEPALSESQAILAQYIELKSALMALEKDMEGDFKQISSQDKLDGAYLDFLRKQLNQRNALREQYLDTAVYEVFYAEEERYDDYTYSRLLVSSDTSLSEDERLQKITELQSSLPEDVVQSMRKTQITDELKDRTAQVLENGGDHQQVRELRREMFGDEAVQRFDELDQKRALWKTRINDYLTQRTQILSNQGLAKDEQGAQVDALRSTMFDEQEQIRVRSLERKVEV